MQSYSVVFALRQQNNKQELCEIIHFPLRRWWRFCKISSSRGEGL